MTCNKQQIRPCTITTCDAIGDYRFSLGGPYHLTVFRVCPELFSILLLRFGSVALRIVDMHLVVQQRQRFMLVSFQNRSETKTPKQMRKNTDFQKHQLEICRNFHIALCHRRLCYGSINIHESGAWKKHDIKRNCKPPKTWLCHPQSIENIVQDSRLYSPQRLLGWW